jgi:hypothetical protein
MTSKHVSKLLLSLFAVTGLALPAGASVGTSIPDPSGLQPPPRLRRPRRETHMRRLVPLLLGVALVSAVLASQAAADATQFVSMTFAEPIAPTVSTCPVAPEGFCGSGEVIPLGHATETIAFGAGCGGSCDLRTVNLADGSLFLEEAFGDGSCPGVCQPNPASPGSGTLTDVVAGGTGVFAGATGTLSGTVRAAGGIVRPAGTSTIKLSGTIHYDP